MLLLALASALATPKPSFEVSVENWDFPTSDGCAASGLRIVTQRDARAPIATVVTTIDVGSADDPVGKEGLAHLVEHLWFRAKIAGDRTVRQALDAVAHHNAFTYAEETIYINESSTAELPTVLAIEGQRFTDPLRGVDDAVFAAERDIISLELRENRLDPTGDLRRFMTRRLFPEPHPYAHLDDESVESLASITLADVREFVAAHVRPENTSLHLAGDIDEFGARAAVWRAFPDVAIGVPEGTPKRSCGAFTPRGVAAPAPPVSTERRVHTAAVAQRRLAWGWVIPVGRGVRLDVERATVGVLEALLSLSLDHTMVTRWPLCGISVYREASMVVCTTDLEEKADPDLVERAALHGLAETDGDRVDFVLGRVWNREMFRLYASTLAAAEALAVPLGDGSAAPFLASHQTGDPGYHKALWGRLGEASFVQAKIHARDWFRKDNVVRALVAPSGKAGPVPLAMHAVRRDAPETGSPSAAAIRARAAVSTEGLVEARLDNGLQVVIVPYGNVPLVGVELIERGGRALAPVPAFDLLATLWRAWVPRNIGFDLNESMDRTGIEGYKLVDADASGTRWTSPRGNLRDLLWVLQSRLAGEQLFSVGVMDGAEDVTRAFHLGLDDDDQAVQLARSRLYADNPWIGVPSQATLHHAELLPSAQQNAWFRGLRQPQNSVLLIVGGVKSDEALALVHEYLDKWPVPKGDVPARRAPTSIELESGESLALVDGPALQLTRLAGACRLAGDPTGAATATIERMAAATLFREVRNTAGIAYDPWAAVTQDSIAGSVLVMGASIPPLGVGAVVENIRAVVQRLSTTTDDDDVRRGAFAAAGSELLARASIRGMLAATRRAILSPDGAGWFAKHADALAAADGLAIRAAMAPCSSRLQFAVVGPAEPIEASLRAVQIRVDRVAPPVARPE